jgi:hypothetical protein
MPFGKEVRNIKVQPSKATQKLCFVFVIVLKHLCKAFPCLNFVRDFDLFHTPCCGRYSETSAVSSNEM